MASFIEMDPDMFFPLHKHESEQIMIVLEGSIRQRAADKEFVPSKGNVLVMESNELHGGKVSKKDAKRSTHSFLQGETVKSLSKLAHEL